MAVDPTMSRRHAAGAESARGLLFTLLGELALPAGGAAWTSAIIDVLARLGVEEKAGRQALLRTSADGWLAAERHGRRTRWRLTEKAVHLLTDGAERIYTFRPVAAEWDGRIALVLARVPETDRAARHALRTRLQWAGFGSPAPGVWISTHADRTAVAEQVFAEADVADARTFVAEHVGGADLAGMVRQAWDLAALEADYRRFGTDFRAATAADPLARLVEVVHAWRRFPWVDPVLPVELLPARWSGTRAAELFATRHADWTASAAAEWARLNEPDPATWTASGSPSRPRTGAASTAR
jgi:phenylacetic acid degradation operon negative regulatory protein